MPATVWSPVSRTVVFQGFISVAQFPKFLLYAVPLAALVGCPLESDSRTWEAVNTFFLIESQSVAAATTKSPTAGVVPE